MDLRLLRYAVIVAEERHFGRAAERVHLTQSGLSQAVQRLERELGFEIFIRTSRSVELSEAGRVFLADASGLLAAAEQMVERGQAVAEGRSGELHVGYSPSVRLTAARVLADFARQRPSLSVTHRQEYTIPLVTAVRDGSLDAAIVIRHGLDEQLAAEPFADIALVCLAPVLHPLADRDRATLAEIARHQVAAVDLPSLGFWRTFLTELFGAEGLSPQFVNEADPVSDLPMVREGPLWVVPAELSTHAAHEVALQPPRYVPFDLVFRRDGDSAALAHFRRHVGGQIAENSAGSRSQGRRAPAPAR